MCVEVTIISLNLATPFHALQKISQRTSWGLYHSLGTQVLLQPLVG